MHPLGENPTPPQTLVGLPAEAGGKAGGPRPRPARRALPQPSCAPAGIPAGTPAGTPVEAGPIPASAPPLPAMPAWPPSRSVFAARLARSSPSSSPAPSTPPTTPGSPLAARQMGPRHRRTDSGRRPLPSLPVPAVPLDPFSPPPAPTSAFTPTISSPPVNVSPPAVPTALPALPPTHPTSPPSEERTPNPPAPALSFSAPEEQGNPPVPTISIGDEDNPPAVPSTSAGDADAPVVPTISVGDEEDQSAPPVPSFSFDAPDEEAPASARPPVPSISFGEDDGPPVPGIRVPDEADCSSSQAHDHDRSCDVSDGPEPGSASAQRAVAGSMPLGGGFCGGCDKILTGGKVIRAVGALWHPRCFRCAHCNTRLEHVSFYVHEGRAYCHVDYHELFSKRCFHCQTPIVDARFIAIDDPQLAGQKQRYYHDLHFFCAHCGDPFVDPSKSASAPGQQMLEDKEDEPVAGSKPFFTVKGYPYCERCHIQLHRPKCQACRLPISGAQLSALGKAWHPACFRCAGCQNVFDAERFFEHQGKPYDEECYTRLLRSLPRT